MLVSIIIPIYNVAPYIEQCLNSVKRQTYRELEVLLIDDCGTDDSIAIVNRMLSGEEEIVMDRVQYKILHHEHNRGLSAARNTGIDKAQGEWLFFLDSDDWISDDCIETLVNIATQEEGIELAISNYMASNGTRPGGTLLLPDGVYTKSLLDYYLDYKYYVPVWNKLIRSSFLRREKLYFEEGLIHEDFLWSFCTACVVSKLAITNKVTYHYLIRDTSLDHLSDQTIHIYNYARCNILQTEFVLEKGGDFRFNSKIFFWLEKWRFECYQSAILNCKEDIVYELYKMIRRSVYWSLPELFSLRSTRGMKLRWFHKYLPKHKGYLLYTKLINKLGL